MKHFILLFIFLIQIKTLEAQTKLSNLSHSINWESIVKIDGQKEGELVDWLPCQGCISANGNVRVPYFPVVVHDLKINRTKIVNAVWNPVQFWEISGVDTTFASSAPVFKFETVEIHRKLATQVGVLAIRKNNNIWEKLSSFSLELQGSPFTIEERTTLSAKSISQGSVFQAGTWLKIGITQTGVYQLTGNDISNNGLSVIGVNSDLIKMYGTGGKLLSEAGKDYKFDDIPEIAILVEDGGDGIFHPNDRILFYAQDPNSWILNPSTSNFEFRRNIYSDTSYYFLTISEGSSKRIPIQQSLNNPDTIVNSYQERWVYAPENVNVMSAGREWYADVLDFNTSKTVNFSISNLVCNSPANFRIGVMAKSNVAYPFAVKVNGSNLGSDFTPSTVGGSAYVYGADTQVLRQTVLPCNSSSVGVNITYNKSGNQQSIGYINFIEMNAQRKLDWVGSNFAFRSFGQIGRVVGYAFNDYPGDAQVWNVTYPQNTTRINHSNGTFALAQDTIQEFFTFSGNNVPKPGFIKRFTNQNLQGIPVPDLLIVTNTRFLDQANQLANFRRLHDSLSVEVVPIEKVYNEFSSGSQDITAIRNFVMHLYYKDPDKRLKYLLLFGDCSFDYKNRIANNTNFVPTYEGVPSLNLVSSYSSDDYFGILSRVKAGWDYDALMDIGVGRLPAKNAEEGQNMVNKIIHYANTAPTFGNWRTRFTFVADDGDGCLHSQQANDLAEGVQTKYPGSVIKKVFLAAYNQVQNPGGFTSPDCTNDLLTVIDRGSLVTNYTGHGGETVWADEFLFTSDMISNLKNYDRLGFFVTATCDFGRHDYPSQVSGAESLLLNPNGGAVGIMTTGRPVTSYSNLIMNKAFYNSFIDQRIGFTGRIGDVMRVSKNVNSDKASNRGFTLLGDPSGKFAMPEEEVVITNFETDSIQALDLVELKGEIRNSNVKDPDFNGKVFATVFDRPSSLQLNDNEPGSSKCSTVYPYINNVLYNGSVKVKNGEFEMKFFVSKDVSYQIGRGKINLYSMDQTRLKDAGGYKLEVPVGGINPNPIVDEDGPLIKLFMNDKSFLNYGLVGTNADLVVELSDSSGINTSGLGLGHDLMATLDNNEVYILNSYFQSDEGSYKSGSLVFPFRGLSAGLHSITLKAWDNFNNSSSETIWFEVGINAVNGKIVKNVNLYPNPFSNQIFISLENAYAGENVEINLTVFSIAGALISEKTWHYENSIARPGAFNELAWDGKREDGVKLPAGIYFCKIGLKSDTDAAEFKINKKIILLD